MSFDVSGGQTVSGGEGCRVKGEGTEKEGCGSTSKAERE